MWERVRGGSRRGSGGGGKKVPVGMEKEKGGGGIPRRMLCVWVCTVCLCMCEVKGTRRFCRYALCVEEDGREEVHFHCRFDECM